MEGAGGTDTLHNLAPNWSLAGDEQLLNLLQNTHQKILSKCQVVNTSMEQMVTALDDASINLQNVNNKFMALSNIQFIESRVYDDDLDFTTETVPVKEPPKEVPTDNLQSIKRGLAVLESLHSPVTILRDSDTESSDDEHRDRLVLKPKDMYADRPLPYIIGSQAWKGKWHAGLLVEESDTESTTSKHDDRDSEDYSDSEPELGDTANIKTDTLNLPDRTISETSSELPSEQDVLPPVIVKQTPSDIATELARRLGGPLPKVVDQEPEYSPPKPTVKKIYRPEQPVSGTIFSDEPPPIDQYLSDGEYGQEDDDIFAEIHKNKPYFHTNKEQSQLVDDLFGFNNNAKNIETKSEGDRVKNKEDIFSQFAKEKLSNLSAKEKTSLFEDESEPEIFADNPQSEPVKHIAEREKSGVKKPVGGISLFGTYKGAESIGAAILNRNRRKSSTSSQESGKNDRPQATAPQNITVDEIDTVKTKKDIFDDLFAKSERIQKKNTENFVKNKVKKDVKVDLFNDNPFDDIDDIFTSNIIKIPVKDEKSNKKSLFSDDDDLFTDIAITKTIKNEATSSKENKKILFDSDDDLFNEKETLLKKSTNDIKSHSDNVKTSQIKDKLDCTANSSVFNKESKSLLDETKAIKTGVTNKKTEQNIIIFDSDSNESDNDIFSDINTFKNEKDCSKPEYIPNLDTSNSQSENNGILTESYSEQKNYSEAKSPSIRALDDALKVISDTKNTFQSPLLFENEDINDLLVNTSKLDLQNANLSQEAKIDQEHLGTVSNIIENAEVGDMDIIENDKNTKSNIQRTKTIEEYVIPDKIDDDEIFKFVETETKIVFDNNPLKNQFFVKKTKRNTSNENLIDDIKDKSVTEIVNVSDTVVSEKPKIETQSNLDINAKLVESKIQKIDSSIIGSDSSVPEKTDKLSENKGFGALFSVSEESDFNTNYIFKAEDNIRDLGDNAVFSIPKESVSNKPNIFDDIFSEPPAFEKPKESKKSKNINALFDDDSDDEALFFKKNDLISDEKPEDFTANVNKNLFGLFHDEPPAIDVDFSPETSKNDDFKDDVDNKFSSVVITEEISNKKQIKYNNIEIANKVERDISNESLFASMLKNDQSSELSTKTEEIHSTEQLFNAMSKHKKTIPENEQVLTTKAEKHLRTPQDSYITQLEESVIKPDKLEDSQLQSEVDLKKETTKIGKINTKSLNINVNALLPGSSLKKYPKDQSDGQTISASNEELGTDKIESKIVKSISFEAEPDSGVLDNKISKQRAKIQVKRRPSSRRARHEAVRKSGIDFGDDSTDNSSSIDDPPMNIEGTGIVLNRNTTVNSMENSQKKIKNETKIVNRDRKNKENSTKIVYILNDEDIFNTNTTIKSNEVNNKIQKTKILNIVDDAVDLFKSKNPASNVDTLDSGLKTLGKAYSNQNEAISKKESKVIKEKRNVAKKTIFNDLSDEEYQLFNENKNKVAKVTIFDSDSEGELFTAKSKKETAVERKGEVVKGSLFGDDEDDEDLFGAKTKISMEKLQTSKVSTFSTSKEINKLTESVTDDPLSMLGTND